MELLLRNRRQSREKRNALVWMKHYVLIVLCWALLQYVNGFSQSSITLHNSHFLKVKAVALFEKMKQIDLECDNESIVKNENYDLELVSSSIRNTKDVKNLPSVPAQQLDISVDTAIVVNETNEKNMMLALLWIIALLSAVDRVSMSVALVPMSVEFDFTDTVKGSISSLFSLGYGLAILPAGLLVANASPRIVLASGIIAWSLATLLTPGSAELMTLAAGATMAPLLLVRACVGVGESLFLPTAQRFLTVWTTTDQKGFAIALIFSGFKTGTILAYLLSPIIMESFGGWRALFYTFGGAGVFITALWLTFAKDSPTSIEPKNPPLATTTASAQSTISITTEEDNRNDSSTWDKSVQVLKDAPWEKMFLSKGVWAMVLAHSAKNWALYNTLSWTPTFYSEEYGIGVRESAVLSVLPSIAGVVGGFVAGFSVDAILRKIQTDSGKVVDDEVKSKVRKVFQGVSLYGGAIALGTLAIHIPEEAWVAQTFLTMSVGLQAFGAAGFEGGNQDKAGEKWAGLLYSVSSLPAVMFGTLGVWTTGRVLDLTNQDWSYVFALTAIINIIGATAFILLFDSKKEFD